MEGMDSHQLKEFAERGGLGTCMAKVDVLAQSDSDLMFLSGERITVLKHIKDDIYLGYCEGVAGRFSAEHVHFIELDPQVLEAIGNAKAANGETIQNTEQSSLPEPKTTEEPKEQIVRPSIQREKRMSRSLRYSVATNDLELNTKEVEVSDSDGRKPGPVSSPRNSIVSTEASPLPSPRSTSPQKLEASSRDHFDPLLLKKSGSRMEAPPSSLMSAFSSEASLPLNGRFSGDESGNNTPTQSLFSSNAMSSALPTLDYTSMKWLRKYPVSTIAAIDEPSLPANSPWASGAGYLKYRSFPGTPKKIPLSPNPTTNKFSSSSVANYFDPRMSVSSGTLLVTPDQPRAPSLRPASVNYTISEGTSLQSKAEKRSSFRSFTSLELSKSRQMPPSIVRRTSMVEPSSLEKISSRNLGAASSGAPSGIGGRPSLDLSSLRLSQLSFASDSTEGINGGSRSSGHRDSDDWGLSIGGEAYLDKTEAEKKDTLPKHDSATGMSASDEAENIITKTQTATRISGAVDDHPVAPKKRNSLRLPFTSILTSTSAHITPRSQPNILAEGGGEGAELGLGIQLGNDSDLLNGFGEDLELSLGNHWDRPGKRANAGDPLGSQEGEHAAKQPEVGVEHYSRYYIHTSQNANDSVPSHPHAFSSSWANDSDRTKAYREKESKWLAALSSMSPQAAKDSSKLKKLVRTGIPDSLRGRVWQFLVGTNDYYQQGLYQDFLSREPHESNDTMESDVRRWFPSVAGFRELHGFEEEELYHVLRVYAHYNPKLGYCQGLAHLAATMLTQLPSEDAFWLLVATIDRYLSSYFTPAIYQLRVDAMMFDQLLRMHQPKLAHHLSEKGVMPLSYMAQWWLTAYALALPLPSTLRIWDIFFYEGATKIFFRVGVAIMEICRDYLLFKCRTSDELIAALRHLPAAHLAPDRVVEVALRVKVGKGEFKKIARKATISLGGGGIGAGIRPFFGGDGVGVIANN
ncbi:uncharacterized protein VTP21DRAFT_884 [Calcarisporiella thermophila]|uniref:uncharacterized protein n=1 Tax=Calcarisporiella thermophila TaxID=911321 RepID=UPI00374281F9